MENGLIAECYKKSIALLIKNSTPNGFLAATPSPKASSTLHYNWIFGRDASICSLGAVASGHPDLLKTAKQTLLTLSRQQTSQGQIPNAVSADEKKAEYYYSISVDGTLWWLIALKFYHRYSRDKKLFPALAPQVKKALNWLNCQTGGASNLIEQADAGDWADLMPYRGHVLYANILWYSVQKLYKLPGAALTKSGINTFLYPFNAAANSLFYKKNFLYARLNKHIKSKIKPTDYFLSHISVYTFGRHCDVYGNILALLSALPEKNLKSRLWQYLLEKKVSKFYPVQVLTPPIAKNDKEWSETMEHQRRNEPFCYHNGGIWPYVGGFWVMALSKEGKKQLARQELEKLAAANKANNWQFNEWLHGQTGQPLGMPGQSWNAGTFLLAYHYLQGKFKHLFL